MIFKEIETLNIVNGSMDDVLNETLDEEKMEGKCASFVNIKRNHVILDKVINETIENVIDDVVNQTIGNGNEIEQEIVDETIEGRVSN